MKLIEPKFGYELDGYRYLGRGGKGGWSRNPRFFYRCANCGDLMQASFDDYFNCKCNAVHLDKDAGRFGSKYGDDNILIYEKLIDRMVDTLTALTAGATIEVICEFRDFDGKVWPPGSRLINFQEYNCVPYHGGYTFRFENEDLRMCDLEENNREVMSEANKFFKLIL